MSQKIEDDIFKMHAGFQKTQYFNADVTVSRIKLRKSTFSIFEKNES